MSESSSAPLPRLRVLSGEIIDAKQDFRLPLRKQPQTAQERLVHRNEAVISAGVRAKYRLAEQTLELDMELAYQVRTNILTTAAKFKAERETLTDPELKALVREVDGQVVQEHGRHQFGVFRHVSDQAAELLDRDITPLPMVGQTRWQRLLGGFSG